MTKILNKDDYDASRETKTADGKESQAVYLEWENRELRKKLAAAYDQLASCQDNLSIAENIVNSLRQRRDDYRRERDEYRKIVDENFNRRGSNADNKTIRLRRL